MEKKFVKPEIEVIRFSADDIIVASGGNGDDTQNIDGE